MSRPGTPALEARLVVVAGDFTLHAEVRLEAGVLVLFGPSGAGKSLTLKALAGLLRPREGLIRVRGETLLDTQARVDVPAHRRGVGYVPQLHALLPFLDVADNVAFGLPRGERRREAPHVRVLLEELGLEHLARARPERLSGGERQRVALARALATRPHLLLLDEPFASIDLEGRVELRRVLRETLRRHDTPALFVTHDAAEAREVGDEVLRFARGRTLEAGPPHALLGGAAPLRLDAKVGGEMRLLQEGEAELSLTGGVLRGPAHLLRPDAQGRLLLTLPGDDGSDTT